MTKRCDAIDSHVARRLRAARISAGISQEAVGGALGVTFQQIQKYETGANRVGAGKLARLAKLFNRPIGWFFEGAPGAEGAAEQPQPDLLAAVLSQHHGRSLLEAFLQIDQLADRAALVQVIRAMGQRPPLQQAAE